MGEKKKQQPTPTPTVWFSLKKSLHCKSEPSDVQSPKTRKQLNSILTSRKTGGRRSGCSRSIANLKDVIHGSKRHPERPPSCSPRSIGSSEFLNSIAHEVILSNSRCELKITGFGGFHDGDNKGSSTFVDVGTLRPGTPGPGGDAQVQQSAPAPAVPPTMQHYFNPSFRSSSTTTPPRKTMDCSFTGRELGLGKNGGFASTVPVPLPCHRRASSYSFEKGCNGSGVACPKCGEQFPKWEALESHHLSKHAVTELVEGDSSRKIVEIICRSSWLKAEGHCVRIDKVFKVHNTQQTLARFEDYRETVKIKASKLPKKHPRCLADGNELLRFHGTTLACSIGNNGSSSLCISDKCCVCRIIRRGFSTKTELKGGVGVFTTSTSGRAFEGIEMCGDEDGSMRKALVVCRVIAGRVHRPVEKKPEEMAGFDSLAGKVGVYSNIEELYLLNPKALLPCFVVICKN